MRGSGRSLYFKWSAQVAYVQGRHVHYIGPDRTVCTNHEPCEGCERVSFDD